MATERLPMHNLREILRQRLTLARSYRGVAAAVGVSVGSFSSVLGRAAALGLDWNAIEALDDDELEIKLYGPRATARDDRPLPDPAQMHLELRRAGVTLQLLHLEYLERHPDGYRYTKFCDVYREWLARRSPSMRQVHIAGDKMFVDYSGKKPRYVDPETGEIVEAELFVAALGASNHTYAEATRTQSVADWTASNGHALAFFTGVPRSMVPDQLKSAVTVPCRYEPGIQRTFQEFGRHYGTTIFPARPKSPRDKAKVEAGVLIAQRWILVRLPNQTFHSLAELNARVRELCDDLNRRMMRRYGASRLELFERLDKPALAALPAEPFEHADWEQVRLNVDYHADVDGHFYSAPLTLVHERLWARSTATTVELFHRCRRMAAHARGFLRGGHTTDRSHTASTNASRCSSMRSGWRARTSASDARSRRPSCASRRRAWRTSTIHRAASSTRPSSAS